MAEELRNQTPDPMGRPPINDEPMTSAERQRRRRHRLNKEPWNDPRSLAWSVVAALRGLQGEDAGKVDAVQLSALVDRAVKEMGVEAENTEAALAALKVFLDPDEPLPVRGKGHHREGRGRRHGGRHRRRPEGSTKTED